LLHYTETGIIILKKAELPLAEFHGPEQPECAQVSSVQIALLPPKQRAGIPCSAHADDCKTQVVGSQLEARATHKIATSEDGED